MTDDQRELLLGQPTEYPREYDPTLLCPFPRREKRRELGLVGDLPFTGYDIWNAYELSWLDRRGKPVIAIGEFEIPCSSPRLIESKSFKLYLNSFNQSCWDDPAVVERQLGEDIGAAAGAPVKVRLRDSRSFAAECISELPGVCLDDQELTIDTYDLAPELLAGAADSGAEVSEEWHSHLLKSNCLVTRQPDWGSILIRYTGPRINPEALLRYLISFRRHDEFHEQCVERVFVDIQRFCRPRKLTVYARYTRRGGLDINPFRSNYETWIANLRLARQ